MQENIQDKQHNYTYPARWIALIIFVAILIFACVFFISRKNATAWTSEPYLDCVYILPEGDAYEDFVVHEHDENCYAANGSLVCKLEEIPYHIHDETCYGIQSELICDIPESDGHTHDETCLGEIQGILICESTEDDHVHTDECYEWIPGYICGLEESEGHRHDEGLCYADTPYLICDKIETPLHTHDENCFDEYGNWICGVKQLQIHQHDRLLCWKLQETIDEDDVEEQDNIEPSTPILENPDLPQEPEVPITEDDLSVVEDSEDDIYANPVEQEFPNDAMDADQDVQGDENQAYCPQQTFHKEIEDVNVDVIAPGGAFPDGTTMEISLVTDQEIIDGIANGVKGNVTSVFAVDITFKNAENNEIEPLKPIQVKIWKDEEPSNDKTSVVHVDKHGDISVLENVDDQFDTDAVQFEASDFSIYAVVKIEIVETIVTQDGHNYTITVTCNETAEMPVGAHLSVREIYQDSENSEEYDGYISNAADAISANVDDVTYARVFDICILDGEENPWQPPEGETLQVNISLDDWRREEAPSVVHFGDAVEVLEADIQNEQVQFDTDGFSVYVILDAPTVESDRAVLLKGGSYYFLNEYWEKSGRNLIKKSNVRASAAEYYLRYDGTLHQYKIYCIVGGDNYYVKLTYNDDTRGGLMLTNDPSEATMWTISQYPDDNNASLVSGELNGITYYWNMQGGNNGNGFAAWYNASDNNNKITIIDIIGSVTEDDDPYELDGKSFGIAYRNGEISACALSTDGSVVSNLNRLSAQTLTVRPDILDSEGYLLASGESDVQEWTFESIERNVYYLTTSVNGTTKYLTIRSTGVTLETEPDDVFSRISVDAGTGANQGTYVFYCQGRILMLVDGKAANGFGVSDSVLAPAHLNIIQKSETLTDADFVKYSAYKVNVSDRVHMHNKSHVVMYTRIWNKKTLNYDFYIVDHSGKLMKCYESGDTIEWIGGPINTAELEFTEYYYEGTTDPNHYYELQNVYTEQYVAPQMNADSIWLNRTIGVNMNGRRYGEDYTSIIAWDNPYYDYAGLKVEGGEVVPCPWTQSSDFYFALIDEDDPYGQITTVDTVDNSDYGIVMKMIDFNEGEVNNRNIKQTEVLGSDTNVAGIVKRTLETSGTTKGFPKTDPSITGKAENSLYTLFGSAYDVNHLFILSTHEEGGYFEFDSTKHFAYLGDGTEFTVYDQLVSIETSSKSMEHGQFMPYNWLVNPDTGEILPYSSMHPYNLTTTTNDELPDTDPRKGETMYGIPKQVSQYPTPDSPHPYGTADYYFGMSLEASFTQTPSGLDAWGHDIIFEFSGDDDFWLYVDGNLVLDLGGVHSALTGSVNFRTGIITSSRGNTTLKKQFSLAYQETHPSATQEEIDAYLDDIFDTRPDGTAVFKDYSAHDMKMFYMERGSGASNLHMRFNLTASRKGYVTLTKDITGTDIKDYALAEFPYQVYYKTTDDGERDWHLIDEMTGGKYNVVFEGSNSPVPFSASFTPTNGTDSYNNVFFLKPNQGADIKMPENCTTYYIVECGVSDEIYDIVTANGATLSGVDVGGDGRSDYAIAPTTADATPRVAFVNHVQPPALRTLTITKKLYDADGVTLLSSEDDTTTFDFRLYLGTEDAAAPTLAYMFTYHVRDENHNYCSWDATNGCFVSTGETLYSNLTDEQKASISFTTSANGAISKIPVGYSIEVRNLLIGSKFKIEERSQEIPKGYKMRELDGYTRVGGSYISGETDNTGTIRANSDPAVEVRNQRGWGLSAVKDWSDESYVIRHAPIYLAVYADGTLVNGSIRELSNGTNDAYWFFDTLETGLDFDDYEVYEVILTGTVETDADGNVTSYGTLSKVDNYSQTTVGAVPKGESAMVSYVYSVDYERGTVGGENNNLRTDTVHNRRDGIQVIKTDYSGNPLAGAVFTIEDSSGDTVGSDSYTSNASGKITTLYVGDGEYHLAETSAPSGYVGLLDDVTITVISGVASVIGDDVTNGMCTISTAPSGEQTIQVKNKPFTLKAVKFGMVNDVKTALANATFAVYRQVMSSSGEPRKDYFPLLENLTSNSAGLIVDNLQTLGVGTYYLVETDPPQGYSRLANDVCFTIHPNGVVTVEDNADRELIRTENNGTVNYEIDIINTQGLKKVRLVKVDRSLPNVVLEGAEFALYGTTGGVRNAEPIYGNLVSDANGILKQGSVQVLELDSGVYHLVETHPPNGYRTRTDTIVITVGTESVTYDEGTTLSSSGQGISYDSQNQIYTLKVSDESGYELPETGGYGVGLLYRYSWIMIAGFAICIFISQRPSKRRKAS